MSAVGTALVAVTAAANAGIAVADVVPAPFVVTNSAEVGVAPRWIPVLASLKLAGAIGLVAGLVGLTALGFAAAVGLAVFFVGAVLTHARARVFHNIGFPLTYLALAVGALVVFAGRL
jgi:hypothetical protein